MRKWVVIIVVVVVVIVVGLGVFLRRGGGRPMGKGTSPEGANQAENRVPVEVIEVKRGDIQRDLVLVGDISANSKVDVFSKAMGVVEKISVEEGDKISQGEIIAEIEKDEVKLQLDQAQAALKSAQITLESLTVERDRLRRLHAEGGVSKQQLDSIETQYKTTEAQIDQARAAVKLADIRLQNTSIKAPISGIISDIYPEECSTAVLSAPFASIVDIDKVRLTVNAIEKDIPMVRVGQEARIKVDTYPEKTFIGTVSNIGTVIDPRTRTAKVEIEIPNPDHLLKPGMFASVRLTVVKHEDVLILPIDAVIRSGDQRQVFIVQDGKASMKPVETGITEGDFIEIKEGVGEGQIVVVAGNQNLVEGDSVLVVEGGD